MADPLGLIGRAGGAANLRPLNIGGANPAANAGGPSFNDVLMKNIEQVNELQQGAEKAIEDLAAGRRDDLANVMIAKQKADTAFKMLVQVRNKLMDAYDEVKQLRV
jgi:flagellar hook-basal body complex protein FliE